MGQVEFEKSDRLEEWNEIRIKMRADHKLQERRMGLGVEAGQ